MTFADLVRAEIRAEMGRQQLTQTALAKKMGWEQSAISKRLRGVVPITADEIERIAKALEIPVERLGFMPTTRSGQGVR